MREALSETRLSVASASLSLRCKANALAASPPLAISPAPHTSTSTRLNPTIKSVNARTPGGITTCGCYFHLLPTYNRSQVQVEVKDGWATSGLDLGLQGVTFSGIDSGKTSFGSGMGALFGRSLGVNDVEFAHFTGHAFLTIGFNNIVSAVCGDLDCGGRVLPYLVVGACAPACLMTAGSDMGDGYRSLQPLPEQPTTNRLFIAVTEPVHCCLVLGIFLAEYNQHPFCEQQR